MWRAPSLAVSSRAAISGSSSKASARRFQFRRRQMRGQKMQAWASGGKYSPVAMVFCSLRYSGVRARDLRERGEIFVGGDEQAIVLRKLAEFGIVDCRASFVIHLPNLFCELRQGYATTLLSLVKRFVIADFLYTAKGRTVFPESSTYEQMQSLHAGAKALSMVPLMTATLRPLSGMAHRSDAYTSQLRALAHSKDGGTVLQLQDGFMACGQYSPSNIIGLPVLGSAHLHWIFITLNRPLSIEAGGSGVKSPAVSMLGDSADVVRQRSVSTVNSPIVSRINTHLHTRLGAHIVGDGGSRHPY